MPDVTLIPAIASFFGVSTDELFDFHLYETEKSVYEIVAEHRKYFDTDNQKAEQVLRRGLKKHPGNDILLDCLMGILCELGRNEEVITIGRSLVESTKQDDIRFDAYRTMAEAYKSLGEYQAAKDAIEQIPELYFTKLGVAAKLLEGEDRYEAAQKQKNISAEELVNMLIIIGKHLKENGEAEKAISQFKIAKRVMDAFEEDFVESKYFKATVFDYTYTQRQEIELLLR